jgi:hypothetical protein
MPCLKRNLSSAITALKAGSKQVWANRFAFLSFAKSFIAIPKRNASPSLILGTVSRGLFLFLVICITCSSCFLRKDLQAELTYATLVKVEEVKRYPNLKQKMLTWETSKLVSFKTFESPSVNIPIGTKTRVLVFK